MPLPFVFDGSRHVVFTKWVLKTVNWFSADCLKYMKQHAGLVLQQQTTGFQVLNIGIEYLARFIICIVVCIITDIIDMITDIKL